MGQVTLGHQAFDLRRASRVHEGLHALRILESLGKSAIRPHGEVGLVVAQRRRKVIVVIAEQHFGRLIVLKAEGRRVVGRRLIQLRSRLL